jgi:hypothetical protein
MNVPWDRELCVTDLSLTDLGKPVDGTVSSDGNHLSDGEVSRALLGRRMTDQEALTIALFEKPHIPGVARQVTERLILGGIRALT